jgi:hypothetical protein
MTLQQKIQQTELIADAIQQGKTTYTYGERMGFTCWNVPLPSPQRCGTSIQQRSYATDKAKEILEGLER